MARPSVSNVLNRIKRIRILTIIACFALVIIAGQMTLFRGDKTVSAQFIEDGVNWDPATNTCVITRSSPMGTVTSPQRIPAFCEDRNVVINGNNSSIYVDASLVRVWQSNVSVGSSCSASYTDGSGKKWDLLYLDDSSGQCVYQQSNSISLNYIVAYGPNLPLPAPDGNQVVIRVPSNSTNIYDGKFFELTGFDARGCVTPVVGSNFQYFGFKNGLCYYNYSAGGTKYYSTKQPDPVIYSAGSDCTLLDGSSAFSGCDSKRHFLSLVLQNGAVLTHQAVTIIDMLQDSNNNKTLADETTGLARFKKVDIETIGDITIDANSRIDVTAKGYPGANPGTLPANNFNGYGRGGGKGQPCSDKGNCQGSGAGYGGRGRQGSSASYPGGATYDEDLSEFDFGSGGGGSSTTPTLNTYWFWFGGSGGGRVRLKANKVELAAGGKILANGWGGINNAWGDSVSQSGGGSGGSIYITVNQQPSAQYLASAGTQSAFAGVGSVKSSGVSIQLAVSLDQSNISAGGGGNDVTGNDPSYNTNTCIDPNDHGGLCGGLSGKGGGGGRISIIRLVSATTTIKKVLKPINRPWNVLPPNSSFDPYAVQKDDLIQVDITLGNYDGTLELTDEYLKTIDGSSPMKCAYSASLLHLKDPNSSDSTKATWFLDQSYVGQTIWYQCRVQ